MCADLVSGFASLLEMGWRWWTGRPGVPDSVKNLKIKVKPDVPSVMLTWDPPQNIKAEDVTRYHIHFKPQESCNTFQQLSVDGHHHEITLGRTKLKPLTTYDFKVRAVSSDGEGPWTAVTECFLMTPGPVQNLKLTLDQNKPSLTLDWEPPTNIDLNNPSELTQYEISFKSTKEQEQCIQKIVSSPSTTLTLTRRSGLILDSVCQFSVRAKNCYDQTGKWVSKKMLIDWNYQCQLPGCTKERQERPDKSIYNFCCKEHATKFADVYCLYGDYPGCEQRIPTSWKVNFCELHLQQAKEEGFTAVVELDSQSKKYRDLCKKFQKDWAKEKGQCPSVIAIVRIVNPVIAERFESYRSKLPVLFQRTEKHYHGTTLCCDLAKYAELCNDPNCGACGIARRGFDPQKINLSAWQRFGNGFYFAYNSSKAYDYAVGNRFGATVSDRNTRYNAVLVCKIAPGRKYDIRYHTPHLDTPPSGYKSFHGKRKGILGKGELNYDELVIFDYEAICPCYIIFC